MRPRIEEDGLRAVGWGSGVAVSRLVLTLTLVASGSLAVVSPPAMASGGGLKPSLAPAISIGTHYFGTTNHAANDGNYEYDFWKLPPVLAADVVTLAWNDAEDRNLACVAVGVDDFSWGENECNGSEAFSVTGSGSARSSIEVGAANPVAYLEFYTCCTGGPYDFTVESIQHAIGVGLTKATEITPTSVLTGSANLSSGAPVPDGMAFTLTAAWITPVNKASHQRAYVATSSGGQFAFQLGLPAGAQGKSVSFTVTRAADPQYLAASSAAVEIPVSRAEPDRCALAGRRARALASRRRQVAQRARAARGPRRRRLHRRAHRLGHKLRIARKQAADACAAP